jgi:hypothetical protein
MEWGITAGRNLRAVATDALESRLQALREEAAEAFDYPRSAGRSSAIENSDVKG